MRQDYTYTETVEQGTGDDNYCGTDNQKLRLKTKHSYNQGIRGNTQRERQRDVDAKKMKENQGG